MASSMEVQVISKEIIKPSSPTPENLRRYRLSFLDQLARRAYSPFIYYYALDNRSGEPNFIAEISEKLKKSLSQALTLYYPLAGRFIDAHFLDCNGEGVPFFEARVTTKLSDVLKNPIPSELNKLLPFQIDEIAELPLGVQLNVFQCGAIAVGLCFSHRLEDALSSLVFVRSWMAIARGEKDAVARPEFISGDLFPPEHSFGNYFTRSATTGSITSACTGDDYCQRLARKIDEEIRRIDKDFVAVNFREKGDDMLENLKKGAERSERGEEVGFVVTSLCRFPLYEADFGLGKPAWVSSAARGFSNLVALFDNKSGDGIEAYICLKPDHMAKLEADKEFLAFVSPN